MAQNILTLLQTFTDKMGLPTPSALMGSQEKTVKQYRGLFAETVLDLKEYRWQRQKQRMTFTSVAASSQGSLTTLFPGYKALVKDTMWNDTRHMRIFGPVNDPVWNALQTLPNAGPEFTSWVSQNLLYVSPTLAAGETISAIVWTEYLCTDVSGNLKEYLTADTDFILAPDNVVLRLFESKWRRQKGEADWESVYNDAIGLVNKNMVKDGMPNLSMAQSPNHGPRPGIIIPPGSWPT